MKRPGAGASPRCLRRIRREQFQHTPPCCRALSAQCRSCDLLIEPPRTVRGKGITLQLPLGRITVETEASEQGRFPINLILAAVSSPGEYFSPFLHY